MSLINFELWWRRLTCPHTQWEPIDPTIASASPGSFSLSWSNMRCLGCGKFRDGNLIMPGETVSIPLEGFDGDLSIGTDIDPS
jgi:hypothetical protein